MQARRIGSTALATLAIVGLALIGDVARAASIKSTNLIGLLREAQTIVAGTVTNVTDGIAENGLPYTEIEVAVERNLRGDATGTYTFRQLGLTSSRLTPDGTKTMLAAPEGMPQYSVGESVLLFVGPQARMTGLRTTVGLGNGKFDLRTGRAENTLSNEGLFRNVGLDSQLETPNVTRMLQTQVGAVNDVDFVSLVKSAIDNRWVETCRMWDTAEGKTCNGKPGRSSRPVKN